LQAFLRAGCVHLTFEVLQLEQGAINTPSWQQLAAALGPDLLAGRPALLQLGRKAAVLAPGAQVVDTLEVESITRGRAKLQQLSPCCVVAGQPAHVQLHGRQLAAAGNALHAGCEGHFLQQLGSSAAQDGGSLLVQMPAGLLPGRVCFELEQGALVGAPLLLLVVPDAEMAAEAERLRQELPAEQSSQVGPCGSACRAGVPLCHLLSAPVSARGRS
jgi:hypothetical protein